MFCIKMTYKDKVVGQHSFTRHEDRHSYLRNEGFLESGGVWLHPFTKEIAGLFTISLSGKASKEYDACHKQITSPRKGPYFAT